MRCYILVVADDSSTFLIGGVLKGTRFESWWRTISPKARQQCEAAWTRYNREFGPLASGPQVIFEGSEGELLVAMSKGLRMRSDAMLALDQLSHDRARVETMSETTRLVSLGLPDPRVVLARPVKRMKPLPRPLPTPRDTDLMIKQALRVWVLHSIGAGCAVSDMISESADRVHINRLCELLESQDLDLAMAAAHAMDAWEEAKSLLDEWGSICDWWADEAFYKGHYASAKSMYERAHFDWGMVSDHYEEACKRANLKPRKLA